MITSAGRSNSPALRIATRAVILSAMKYILIFAALILPSLSNAQDVCCVLGKVKDQSAETQAMVRSASDCVAGKADGEMKVCASFKDETNSCPSLSAEDQCKKCGFHWAGSSCLSEDPVKKAKKELEEKAKKEKEEAAKKAAASKTATPTPTATPTATPTK